MRTLIYFVLSVSVMLSVACTKAKTVATELSRPYISFVPSQTEVPTKKNDLTNSALTSPATPIATTQREIIELTSENFVVLDQVYSDASVSQVMLELNKLSNKLPKDATIYLVLNSPGGSVDSGMSLITFVKAIPQNVKTLSIFSASMGFQTVQNLGERLVLPNSTLMSHRAKFGVRGEAPGEMFSQLNYVMSIINGLDQTAAARMGMSFDEYRKLVADEYWTYGENAVGEKAADRVVLAKCSQTLFTETKSQNVETMFGDFEVQTSKCPLIPGALSVEQKLNTYSVTHDGKTIIKTTRQPASDSQVSYVRMMFENKTEFVSKYILTNEYQKFQK